MNYLKHWRKTMNNIAYGVSDDESEILSENIDGVLSKMRNGKFSPQEFKEVAQLLTVNQGDFEKYKAETWFKKAWFVISGNRGKLTDVSIINLGKIQVGVLKLMGEILEDSAGIKNDLLVVLSCLEKIQTQSLELKTLIVKFNQKYDQRFHELQKKIDGAHGALRVSQVVLGFVIIGGAVILFIPGFRDLYWQYGLAAGGVAGIFFIGQYYVSSGKKKRMIIPIRIKKNINSMCEAVQGSFEFLKLSPIDSSDQTITVESQEIHQNQQDSVELTRIEISSMLRISAAEEKVFKNMNIDLKTFIRCEGSLVFDSCTLSYGENKGGQLIFDGAGSLKMVNCYILCDGVSPREDSSAPGFTFVISERGNDEGVFVFEKTTFESCVHFLKRNNNGSVEFSGCCFDNPGNDFLKSEQGLLTLKDSIVRFDAPPLSVVFQAGSSAQIINCVIESSCDLNSDSYPVFGLIADLFEKCTFKNLKNFLCISYRIIDCEFDNCADVWKGFGCHLPTVFENCLFRKCSDILSYCNGVTLAHCQFIECRGHILFLSRSSTVEYCEIINSQSDQNIFSLHDKNKLKRCLFDGVHSESFLIDGFTDIDNLKSGPAVEVVECEFRNCSVGEECDGLIRMTQAGTTGKLLRKNVIREFARVTNCRGVDPESDVLNGKSELVIERSLTPVGSAIVWGAASCLTPVGSAAFVCAAAARCFVNKRKS